MIMKLFFNITQTGVVNLNPAGFFIFLFAEEGVSEWMEHV